MRKKPEYKVKKHILSRMIFSNRCRICAEVLPINQDVCDNCSVEKIRVSEEKIASLVFTNRQIDGLTAPFYYDEPIKKCIHNFKYNNFKKASEFLSTEMINVIERDFKDENPDYITCIPMSKRRKTKKVFNQGEVLIKYISKAFDRKYTPDLLKKVKNTVPQARLDGKERLSNLKGAFKINEKYDIKDKTVLICDDVITTGSTFEECAKVLKKAGAKRVICAVSAFNSKNM